MPGTSLIMTQERISSSAAVVHVTHYSHRACFTERRVVYPGSPPVETWKVGGRRIVILRNYTYHHENKLAPLNIFMSVNTPLP